MDWLPIKIQLTNMKIFSQAITQKINTDNKRISAKTDSLNKDTYQ